MNFGSLQTKKRSRSSTVGSSGDRRKACPQGRSCPFQHEYQHNLEFSHTSQPILPINDNHRQSFANNNNRSSGAIIPSVFSSQGNKLGGTGVLDRSRLLSQFENQQRAVSTTGATSSTVGSSANTHTTRSIPQSSGGIGRNVPIEIDLTSPHRFSDLAHSPSWVGSPLSNDSCVYCDACGGSIPLHDYSEHLHLHEIGAITTEKSSSNRDRNVAIGDEQNFKVRRTYTGERYLKNQQDDEYDQSIIKEIERQSAIEREQQLSREEELKTYEETAVIESQREAFRLKQLEEHQLAKFRLPPEPTDTSGEDVVALRFTLPSGKRITRRFRQDATMQEVFTFLKTLEELIHIKYELKTVIGNVVFQEKMQQTLRTLGLTANTSLVLVTIDITDSMIEEILNNDLSSPLATPPGPHRKMRKQESTSSNERFYANNIPSVVSLPALPSMTATSSTSRKRGRDNVIDLT